MAKAKSKRQTSKQRHKVERKIREHKRDIRKGAKALKAQGQKPRNKKSRETAKLALRVSNNNPDKEKILLNLIESRERSKAERAARRADNKQVVEPEEEVDREGSDAGSDAGPESTADRLAKRSRGELKVVEERLTSKQVVERQRQQKREADAAVSKEKQVQQMRQHLFIPAGEHVGNGALQTSKIIDLLALEIPAFAIIVDARCPVQSTPWNIVDDIVAAAVLQRDTLRQAEAVAASTKKASAKSGRKSDSKTAAVTTDAGEETTVPTVPSTSVLRLVMFVLNKADLLPLDALAIGFTNLAIAVRERYAAVLEQASPCPEDVPNATGPVTFTAAAHSGVIETSTAFIARSLRKFHADFVASRDAVVASVSNMKGKLGVAVLGLPGVGKTSFCRSLQQFATDSVVSTIPCRSIITAVAAGGEHMGKRKMIVPGSKSITLVTVADNEMMKRAPIACGDSVFHSESRIEKLREPETPAILLAEKFLDQAALCQALSLPLCTSAVQFLKSLGRCVIREKGFQPAGIFSGIGGSLSGHTLTAASTNGAELYSGSTRRVRVRPRHDDRRNALRIGSRCFLKEFHKGSNIVWAIKRVSDSEAAAPDAATITASVNTFAPLYIPKQVLQGLPQAKEQEHPEKAIAAAIAANPGAVLLMAVQFSLRDFMVLLPHRCLELDPTAVIASALTPEEGDSEADDEDDVEDDGSSEFDD